MSREVPDCQYCGRTNWMGHDCEDRCHCGDPVYINDDISSGFTRGLCQHCDTVRCDTWDGDCGRETRHNLDDVIKELDIDMDEDGTP